MLSEKWNVYSNMVKENVMYQQLQKIRRGKVCRIKVFRTNLGKFGQNILFALKKLPDPTPMHHSCCSSICTLVSCICHPNSRCSHRWTWPCYELNLMLASTAQSSSMRRLIFRSGNEGVRGGALNTRRWTHWHVASILHWPVIGKLSI